MGRVQVVVFDVDDTLYLERDYVRSGFRAVGDWLASEHGVTGFSDAAWNTFLSGVRGRIFNHALEALGCEQTPELIGQLVKAYREHDPDIALAPDAAVALEEAVKRGPVSVITDGPVASQERKVRALGLQAVAHPVICTWRAGREFGKPHERAFREVEEATGMSGERLVYVADNPTKDFVAPRALGWRTIRVRRPGGLNTPLPTGDDVDVELGENLEGLWKAIDG